MQIMMKIQICLAVLAVCAVTDSFACGRGSSNSGSSTPNRKASCTFYRNSLQVTCSAPGVSSQTCSAVQPTSSDESQTGGPIPRGSYRIGVADRNNWYNLYPKSSSSNTYYDYYRENPENGRGWIALHSGSVSEGCITVTSFSCWTRLEAVIDRGTRSNQDVQSTFWRTKTIQYTGDLTVV